MTSGSSAEDPRVAVALSRLEEVEGRQPADTMQVYQDVADQLAAVLTDADGSGVGHPDELPSEARG